MCSANIFVYKIVYDPSGLGRDTASAAPSMVKETQKVLKSTWLRPHNIAAAKLKVLFDNEMRLSTGPDREALL